jgi:beta-aspartyl-peptidase (threonine type)
LLCTKPKTGKQEEDGAWAIAAHGGAGAISDKASIPARLKEFEEAFNFGRQMLATGSTAMDAVQEVVARLEDSAYFNAGRGSVFTNSGTHEMDASIMDGSDGTAGAVAMVSNIKNPIHLARTVAKHTQHVMLCGVGASSLAPAHGVEVEDNHYFFTEERYAQLKNARAAGRIVLDHGGEMAQDERSVRVDTSGTVKTGHLRSPGTSPAIPYQTINVGDAWFVGKSFGSIESLDLNGPLPVSEQKPAAAAAAGGGGVGAPQTGKWAEEHKFGTVGCVARDRYGNLAAAGSTGGLTNKHPGRIGDTPIIGAGVYANSNTCAVACTGQGETFIKHVVAHDVHARIKYQGVPLAAAMDEVLGV